MTEKIPSIPPSQYYSPLLPSTMQYALFPVSMLSGQSHARCPFYFGPNVIGWDCEKTAAPGERLCRRCLARRCMDVDAQSALQGMSKADRSSKMDQEVDTRRRDISRRAPSGTHFCAVDVYKTPTQLDQGYRALRAARQPDATLCNTVNADGQLCDIYRALPEAANLG
jgi:hypothetical protein